jgi:hypothetical protein
MPVPLLVTVMSMQRDQLNRSTLQTNTQKAAELFKHFVGSVDIGPHEAGNAVHRVEKEVRIQLHSQGRKDAHFPKA